MKLDEQRLHKLLECVLWVLALAGVAWSFFMVVFKSGGLTR